MYPGSLLYNLVPIFITLLLYKSVLCDWMWIYIFLCVLWAWIFEFRSTNWCCRERAATLISYTKNQKLINFKKLVILTWRITFGHDIKTLILFLLGMQCSLICYTDVHFSEQTAASIFGIYQTRQNHMPEDNVANVWQVPTFQRKLLPQSSWSTKFDCVVNMRQIFSLSAFIMLQYSVQN